MSYLCTVEVRFTEMRQTVSIRLFPFLWPIGCGSTHVNAEEVARGSGEHQEQAVQVLELERRIRQEFGACPRQRAVHPNPVGWCPVMSMPVIVVLSVLTAIGHWRQVSLVSAAAKSFVDIQTVEQPPFFCGNLGLLCTRP